MVKWRFLTNHTCAMVCIADDPGVRLREIAVALDITERSAYTIVSELIDVGYVIKEKHGRRNHYQIQGQMPLRESVGREQTIGDILDVLAEARPPANPDQLTLAKLRN
jgi:predicted transcriptional regulator